MIVKATLVDDILQASREGLAGAIKFYNEGDMKPGGLRLVCPCGCGGIGAVNFKGWSWNGNREKPTVKPSIFFNQGKPGEWHGYLTDGEFIPC